MQVSREISMKQFMFVISQYFGWGKTILKWFYAFTLEL